MLEILRKHDQIEKNLFEDFKKGHFEVFINMIVGCSLLFKLFLISFNAESNDFISVGEFQRTSICFQLNIDLNSMS